MKFKIKEEYKFLSEIGNSFINNNINDKINRFISTCKKIYLLSKIIKINNIINGKKFN